MSKALENVEMSGTDADYAFGALGAVLKRGHQMKALITISDEMRRLREENSRFKKALEEIAYAAHRSGVDTDIAREALKA